MFGFIVTSHIPFYEIILCIILLFCSSMFTLVW